MGANGQSQARRQRWSLAATVSLVTIVLAICVALLIEAAQPFLPRVPGLDYRYVQVGLIVLAVALSAYAFDRERHIRLFESALEDERMEGERLRMLDEVKTAFLRSVSHDLRSPITVILGMAQLLEGRGEGMPAERLRDAAQRIGSQARRLDGMLTDLLDVERVARGLLTLNVSDVDVAELLRNLISHFETRRPVTLEAAPLPARLDAALVERMIDNLIRNADKYTPPGSPIWVKAERSHNGIIIAVEDQGPGVPDALKKPIFELFERGESPPGVVGTGIGLSLVREFARLHNGEAWVEDRPGGGASFRVRLRDVNAAGESRILTS